MFLTKSEATDVIRNTISRFKPNSLEHKVIGNIFSYTRLIKAENGEVDTASISVVIKDLVQKGKTPEGFLFWEVDLYAIVDEEGSVVPLPRVKVAPCSMSDDNENIDLVDIDKIRDFTHYRMLMTADSDVVH